MVDESCYREGPGSVTVRRNIERGTGTGTPKQKITSGIVVPVPHLPVLVPTWNFYGI